MGRRACRTRRPRLTAHRRAGMISEKYSPFSALPDTALWHWTPASAKLPVPFQTVSYPMRLSHLFLLAAVAAPALASAQAAPSAPEVGQMAPDFTAAWADASGPQASPVKLSDLRGKGGECKEGKESHGIQDHWQRFHAR